MTERVEVTPAMIEAGVMAIKPRYADFFDTTEMEGLAALVEAIYRAMRAECEFG